MFDSDFKKCFYNIYNIWKIKIFNTTTVSPCTWPCLGSSPRGSMLPRKNVSMANIVTHPRGLTHASRPTLPIKRHTDAPPRALDPVSARRGALKPSSEHANVAAHPGGSLMPSTRRCPSKGTWMPLPPCNERPSRALGPISTSWEVLKLLETLPKIIVKRDVIFKYPLYIIRWLINRKKKYKFKIFKKIFKIRSVIYLFIGSQWFQ